ncbi:hypothetical protein CDL12_20080 [Handroanthus impetiginosus]|uniref:Uncharacterized protein n=1 Tax=Handroanthus impetiginosus TaxID=429701 RepID=A0A2G9GPX5_9LAMI|nr:hypothetical protein CDL12_20080 [Handroanthus impetiginosus]
MAVAVERKKPRLADFMAKIGLTTAAAAVVVPTVLLFLPGKFKWVSLLLLVIPTIATFLFG